MEFNYEEFKEKYGQEAADIVKNEIKTAEDFGLKWQLEIASENDIWITFMLITQVDFIIFKVYKNSKAVNTKIRISKADCEKALKIMALGA
ncbi:MAG: hypothetical protein WAW77_15190 [Caldibacillus thermoamylovorans]